MHHAFGALLHTALHQHQPCGHHGAAQCLELPRPEHAIGDAGLILQRDEERVALAGPLAHQHQAGHLREPAIGARRRLGRRADALALEMGTQQRHRVRLQRQPHGLVVGCDMLAQTHGRQAGIRLLAQFAGCRDGEKGQRIILRQAVHLPERSAAVEPDRAEGIAIGQRAHRAAMEPGTAGEVLDGSEAVPAHGRQAHRLGLVDAVHLPQAEAQREPAGIVALQRVVPEGMVDVGCPHLHPVLAGIAHDLCGCVKAHRLGIQQGGGKHRGMMAFQPGRDVDQLGEACRVALGKAIGAEALDLLEAILSEVSGIAACHHTLDHQVLEAANGADIAERRHGAAKLVGLHIREPGGDHGQLHGLLLEQRHAFGLAEHGVKFIGWAMLGVGGGKTHRLKPRPAAQVRVHHVALDGAGADDGDLDDEVVELARAQARQHVDLRAAFHLEHAD